MPIPLNSIPNLSIEPTDFEPSEYSLLKTENTVYPIAGFWSRLAAWFIDSLLLGVIGQGIVWGFSSFWFEIGPYGRFVGLLLILPYFGLMNSKFCMGQTLGKRIFGIAVIDRKNKAIGLSRSLIRTMILALPFFLNGWALPILQNPVLLLLCSVIVFGIGGAILYTMIFNQGTRQGLHDLLCSTYVVNLNGDPIAALPLSSKIHKVISGAILATSVVIAGIMGFVTSSFSTTESSFAYLYRAYQTLQADQRFFSASVFDNTSYAEQAKPTRTLRVNVWFKGVPSPEEFEHVTNDVAKVVLDEIENIDDFDLIEISITSAYDLGIASGNFTSGDRQKPDVWRERSKPNI